MKRKNFLFVLFLTVLVSLFGCKKEEQNTGVIDVQFSVPKNVTIKAGTESMSFRVMFGKAPLKSDKVILGEPSGALNTCEIVSVSKKKFSINLYKGLASGIYNVYILRGSHKKLMGSMAVTIDTSADTSDIKVEPEPGNNVYGVVVCGKKRLKDVVVSDGVEVVRTDENGIYQMKSSKKHKYVFISIPSGYEVQSDGIMPRVHCQLHKNPSVPERVDFSLVDVGDQSNYTMLVFGDIQIARRNDDRKQFSIFTDDVNDYISTHKDKKIYGITLGDMTWDVYWYQNSYALDEYVADMNAVKGLQIFHTIGNHDHDMKYAGDFDTVTKYKKKIAPTYFSFNIGKVHYVILDDIECTNTGAGTSDSRDYNENLVSEQFKWLEKDLSYVPTSVPLFVTMHAPLFKDDSRDNMGGAERLIKMLRKYDQVQLFTGHTHKMYNVDKMETRHIFEHNAGAVCATWWWSSYLTPGIHIGQDGTPGGYEIVDIAGDKFTWQFKPSGKPLDMQFRTYDRNTMDISVPNYTPNAKGKYRDDFKSLSKDFSGEKSDNEVYINIWNYDPEWKIEVMEEGKLLSVKKEFTRDPLHLVSYTAKRLNTNNSATFKTSVNRHTFVVKASKPNSTLNIKVTDRFGNVYREDMKRPKSFSTEMYK